MPDIVTHADLAEVERCADDAKLSVGYLQQYLADNPPPTFEAIDVTQSCSACADVTTGVNGNANNALAITATSADADITVLADGFRVEADKDCVQVSGMVSYVAGAARQAPGVAVFVDGVEVACPTAYMRNVNGHADASNTIALTLCDVAAGTEITFASRVTAAGGVANITKGTIGICAHRTVTVQSAIIA